jgi:SAM-dependent methyltransferase
MPAHPKPVVNSTAYWDQRFRDDWENRGGPGQTRFFAEQAVAAMPDWFVQEIRTRRLSIFDFGCAFGDALPVLRRAFPEAVIRGGDVAPGAIATARERHPGFEFVVLDNDAPKLCANVVFCSNTIEHFADWRTKLAMLVTLASDYVVTMAPFRERSLSSEHEAYFAYKTFVPVPGEPSRLDHLRIIDLRSIENTRWDGRQWLGIWSKAAERRSVRSSTAFSPDDLDLRGRTSAEVGALLAAANESDTENEAARTEIAPENHP